jgi:hypothetical protein
LDEWNGRIRSWERASVSHEYQRSWLIQTAIALPALFEVVPQVFWLHVPDFRIYV